MTRKYTKSSYFDTKRVRSDLRERNLAKVTHRMTRTPTYSSWHNMRNRMTVPTNRKYPGYGGRGLDMDPRWMKFEPFLEDMGVMPEGMTLGRKDNEKGYWKWNCEWQDLIAQSNNRRSSRFIEFEGEVKTVTQWAREIGCTPQVISSRIRWGHSPQQTISFCMKKLPRYTRDRA